MIGDTTTWSGGPCLCFSSPSSTACTDNNWNVVSNADLVAQVQCAWMADDVEAAESRKRDLSYLVPRQPALKSERRHNAA